LNDIIDAEKLLREQRLQGDRRQAAGGIIILAATTVLLTYTDSRVLRDEDGMVLSYIIRGVYVFLALAFTVPILRAKKLDELELWIRVNLIIFAFATLAVNWIKVPINSDNLMLSAAAIVLFFVLFPISMKRQLELAAIMVGVGAVVFVGRREFMDPGAWAFFILGYGFAIGLGIALSRSSYRARDQELIALLEREQALIDLAAEQNRVRILEGLLEICAQCKKIHDDDDKWVQMEQYIQKNSEAEFSHGLCPTCYAASLMDIDPLGNNPSGGKLN